MSNSVRVVNLITGAEVFYTCTARKAVIAAYAQASNDWNTWDYEKRYGHLVSEGQKSIACGDWSALKETA